MFCPNCGTKNSEDACFCENCGTDLRNVTPQDGGQLLPVKEKKTGSKWLPIIIVEAAVIILGVFLLKGILDKSNSPERVAEKYFVHMANREWEEAYEELDIKEIEESSSDFINLEKYTRYQEQTNTDAVSGYQVVLENNQSGLNGLTNGSAFDKTVRIDYCIKGEAGNSTRRLTLNRVGNSRWKVGVSDLLCKDYTLYVPIGASINVDGVHLGTEYYAQDNGYSDCYSIPYIFCGPHEIKVTMDDMEDVSETITVESVNGASYSCDSMTLKTEVLDTLIQKAGENMRQIYASAADGKSIKTIENLFTSNTEYLDDIKESYGYLVTNFHEGSNRLQKVRFRNITGKAYANGAAVEISFNYDMDYMYEDWWGEGWEQDTYSDGATIYMSFAKENGNWVQTNLGCDTLLY